MKNEKSGGAMDYAMTIGGERIKSVEAFDVLNPATGDVVAESPKASRDQLDDAVAVARQAFAGWSQTPDVDRQAAIMSAADVLEKNAEELASLLTLEQGKPLNGLGSRFEIGGTVAWARATAALEVPTQVLQNNEDGKVELRKKPLGVVGSITPWNWPLLIAIWHVIPAIRAGNTVVIKPSPFTPLSTLRLVELLNDVFPAGVLNVVSGDDELGRSMAEHPDIDKIAFTGSIAAGKSVMRSSSGNLKRLTLELGGNDAGIVLPDADADAIAKGLFWGAFINGGQTCAALKRLYVPDALHDDVCKALISFIANVPVGDGMEETNLIGPVQNARQYEKVINLVEDAKALGGRILCGGEAVPGDGYFYPLTVVADLPDDANLVVEEQFGPVLPVLRYSDLDAAIERANDSPNGLGGSIWSSDIDRAANIGERLECGSVWINSHGTIQPNAPFGGIKQSGFGVEFTERGLDEFYYCQVMFR